MNWKVKTEILVPDAFEATDTIKTIKGVLSADVVTGEMIRIKYDNRKISEKEIQAILNPKSKR